MMIKASEEEVIAQIQEQNRKLQDLMNEKENIEREALFVRSRLKNLGKNLRTLRKGEISDHAIVRYLEEVEGFDLAELKKKIRQDKEVKKTIWDGHIVKICPKKLKPARDLNDQGQQEGGNYEKI